MNKTLKRFILNKRAITPILSELLLMVIAVAAMSIAISATYVITDNLRNNMSERVVVEDVWFNSATNTVDVYLFNVGKVDATISNIYFNHTIQQLNTPFQLQMDQHNWLKVSYSWQPGDLLYIDIVTTRGLHIADYYTAS